MNFEITEPKTLPLDANGHRLLFPGESDAEVYFIAGFPQVSGPASACGVCDERPKYHVTDQAIEVTNPCPYPDGFTTEITLEVPSGRIVVSDNLGPVYTYDDSELASYNSALGQAQAVRAMAAAGCAYGPVGNSSPGLYRTGSDTYIVASPDYDADDNPALPDADRLAGIITDLWAYSIADFEHWKSCGGDPDRLGWSDTVVDIPPGTYRITHHTGERDFDRDAPGTVVFAHIERLT